MCPDAAGERRPLLYFAVETKRLAKPVEYNVPSSTVFENVSEFDPGFALHLNRDIYSDRIAHVDAIDLIRLEDAVLHAQADYMVSVGAWVVAEQVPPWIALGEPWLPALTAGALIEDVWPETVIVARFGYETWGHWLGELLPKIVAVESSFPKRFSFAVPQVYQDPAFQTFSDSISAYGIEPQRLLYLAADRRYRLRRPWAVTPIWSDYVMHPVAAEIMRCGLRLPAPPAGERRVALVRKQSAARELQNWDELRPLLTGLGFDFVDVADLHFRKQAQTFRDSDAVFSVLGSGLTGLLYSPMGVRVASAAPYLFGDRFFYAMIAERRGRYADLRGPVVRPDSLIPHRSTFSLEPERLSEGLQRLLG